MVSEVRATEVSREDLFLEAVVLELSYYGFFSETSGELSWAFIFPMMV